MDETFSSDKRIRIGVLGKPIRKVNSDCTFTVCSSAPLYTHYDLVETKEPLDKRFEGLAFGHSKLVAKVTSLETQLKSTRDLLYNVHDRLEETPFKLFLKLLGRLNPLNYKIVHKDY